MPTFVLLLNNPNQVHHFFVVTVFDLQQPWSAAA